MTPDEAKQVLAAAEQQAQLGQWADVVHLLQPVHDEQVLTGTDQGDAAYYLGTALMYTHSFDSGKDYVTEATQSASPALRTEAGARLAEFGRHHDSEAAAIFGADAADEAVTLTAADDSLARSDFADAHTRYWAVYDGQASLEHRVAAALGLARVFAYTNDFEQATQYAHYVTDAGNADLKAQAHTLLEWLGEQQGANAASADGTSVDELKQAMLAAADAIYARDWSQAVALLQSVLASAQVSSIDHAKASFNMALAELNLGQEAEAREHFQFAVDHGQPSTAAKATRHLAQIDAHQQAEELVAEPET